MTWKIEVELVNGIYRGLVWDVEDDARLLVAVVEAETAKSARYWAEQELKQIKLMDGAYF